MFFLTPQYTSEGMRSTSDVGMRGALHFYIFHRQSNPDIQDFMREMKFNSSYYLLEDYYISRLLDTIGSTTKKKIKPYVWQEVYDNKVNVSDLLFYEFKIVLLRSKNYLLPNSST